MREHYICLKLNYLFFKKNQLDNNPSFIDVLYFVCPYFRLFLIIIDYYKRNPGYQKKISLDRIIYIAKTLKDFFLTTMSHFVKIDDYIKRY